MRLLMVVATALSLATPAAADVEVDGQHWHNIFIQGRPTPPTLSSSAPSSPSPALFYLELQPRWSLSQAWPDRILLRAAVGWETVRAPGRSLSP